MSIYLANVKWEVHIIHVYSLPDTERIQVEIL